MLLLYHLQRFLLTLHFSEHRPLFAQGWSCCRRLRFNLGSTPNNPSINAAQVHKIQRAVLCCAPCVATVQPC